jgi:hypothetical protein
MKSELHNAVRLATSLLDPLGRYCYTGRTHGRGSGCHRGGGGDPGATSVIKIWGSRSASAMQLSGTLFFPGQAPDRAPHENARVGGNCKYSKRHRVQGAVGLDLCERPSKIRTSVPCRIRRHVRAGTHRPPIWPSIPPRYGAAHFSHIPASCPKKGLIQKVTRRCPKLQDVRSRMDSWPRGTARFGFRSSRWRS